MPITKGIGVVSTGIAVEKGLGFDPVSQPAVSHGKKNNETTTIVKLECNAQPKRARGCHGRS
ncbi:hypothetical protein YTPLAS72_00820 [Nitrospira sp.]|nr:hypothetical protein YTPLAS72_00820 [Nitrospira sp.]